MAKNLNDYLSRGVYYKRLKPDGHRPAHWEKGMTSVGIRSDGSLINPNGYPDDEVRLAIERNILSYIEYRARSTAKGVATRRDRQELQVYEAAQQIVRNEKTGPRGDCCCCHRALSDDESIQRGIGSECWQRVLARVTRLKEQAARAEMGIPNHSPEYVREMFERIKARPCKIATVDPLPLEPDEPATTEI